MRQVAKKNEEMSLKSNRHVLKSNRHVQQQATINCCPSTTTSTTPFLAFLVLGDSGVSLLCLRFLLLAFTMVLVNCFCKR
jgi:hypothetical protein